MALVVLESIARVAYTLIGDFRGPAVRVDPGWHDNHWYRPSPEFGWVPRPDFLGFVFLRERKFDSQGFLAVDEAQLAGTKPKIVVLGDSNSFGNGVSTPLTYAERLDKALPDLDVINLSVPGYTSFQGLEVLKTKALQLEPSLIIVSFNFNDRRLVTSPKNVDSHERMKAIGSKGPTLLRSIYLAKPLASLMGRFRKASATSGGGFEDLSTPNVRVSPDHYRENLREMARIAEQHSIKVAFLLLGDNPWLVKPLAEGAREFEQGNYAEARRRIDQGRSVPFLLQGLSARYLQMIDAAEPMRDPILEKDSRYWSKISPRSVIANSAHGGLVGYLDSDYQQIARSVAEQQGWLLVDAASQLDKEPHVYFDYCHVDAMGHGIIAETLGAAMTSRWGNGLAKLQRDSNPVEYPAQDR
jgi:hypothetical protein